MEEKYIVVSLRKSDNALFFPDNIRGHLLSTESEAQEEATRKAREFSRDYAYVVYKLSAVLSVSCVFPPVEVTRFNN